METITCMFCCCVFLEANRITKGLPGMKGVRGGPGHLGYDGTYGMKGGKLHVIHKLIFTTLFVSHWFDIYSELLLSIQ